MAINHWMTFGTFAEQRYFIYPDKTTYDGIVINGNMATHAPGGLAGFLMEKTREKMPYIIDPLTHAFQHDPAVISSKKDDGTLEVKTPIKTLSEIYGKPISDLLGKRPLLPKDLADEGQYKEFVYKVLQFQKEKLSSRMVETEVNKKYLEHSESDLLPVALVCPYFYMTESTYKLWLPFMVTALKFAREFDDFNGIKIFTSIVISQGIILKENIITDMVQQLSEANADGYLIWVDGLDEHTAGGQELEGLLKLAEGLRSNNTKELINLHGGYFSLLAAGGKFKQSYFSGVAHGPEFGETRAVIPVGGGIPIAKYYIKKLHNRIKYADALSYFNTKGWLISAEIFHEEICNCRECRDVIDNNPDNFKFYGITDSKPVKRRNGFVTIDYPTKETKEHCLKHYLNMKKEEYTFASNSSKEILIEDIQTSIDQFGEITGLEYISYLEIWKDVLTNL